MYHISDIKKYRFCPRFFWKANHQKQTSRMPYIRLEEKLIELAKEKLEIDSFFMGVRNDSNDISLSAFEKNEWGCNVRFEYHGLRVKIPFMQKTDEGYRIFFTYLGVLPKGDDVRFYADNLWVLQQLNLQVVDIQIIHLNAGYIREEDLNVSELFVVSEHFYTPKGNPSKRVFDYVLHHVQDLSKVLSSMEETLSGSMPEAVKLPRCYRRNKCPHYDECFPHEQTHDAMSIYHLVNTNQKDELVAKGITRLDQLTGEDITGDRVQYAQIMAARSGGEFVDRLALKNWIKSLQPPFSFLDFEWDLYAIPPYHGLKPMEVLPFQFSLHMYHDQQVEHEQFLGVGDCREDFIRKLLTTIPEEGTIFAYNADGAEKLRLLELARQFPKYEEALISIADRLIDLAIPFFLGLYYNLEFKGAFTLKRVTEVLAPDLAYDDLNIQHGLQAVEQWRAADRLDAPMDPDVKDQLFAYCMRDTLSMVSIFQYLQKLVSE